MAHDIAGYPLLRAIPQGFNGIDRPRPANTTITSDRRKPTTAEWRFFTATGSRGSVWTSDSPQRRSNCSPAHFGQHLPSSPNWRFIYPEVIRWRTYSSTKSPHSSNPSPLFKARSSFRGILTSTSTTRTTDMGVAHSTFSTRSTWCRTSLFQHTRVAIRLISLSPDEIRPPWDFASTHPLKRITASLSAPSFRWTSRSATDRKTFDSRNAWTENRSGNLCWTIGCATAPTHSRPCRWLPYSICTTEPYGESSMNTSRWKTSPSEIGHWHSGTTTTAGPRSEESWCARDGTDALARKSTAWRGSERWNETSELCWIAHYLWTNMLRPFANQLTVISEHSSISVAHSPSIKPNPWRAPS